MNTPSSSHENTETAGGNTANARGGGADPGICPWCQTPVTRIPGGAGRGCGVRISAAATPTTPARPPAPAPSG